MASVLKNYLDIKNKRLAAKIVVRAFRNLPSTNSVMLSVSRNIEIEPNCQYLKKMNCLVSMGSFSYTNSPLPDGMRVGRYCSIGPNLIVFGAEHFPSWISTSPSFYNKNYFDKTVLPESVSHTVRSHVDINIGHDVWVGSNVAIKNKCKIGNGVIIASNSVVTKDVDDFCIVGGNPAKFIKHRFDNNIIKLINVLNWWDYHLESFKYLSANNPIEFLNILKQRVDRREISIYKPEKLTIADL